MKRNILSSAICLMLPFAVFAEDFSIADETLTSIPGIAESEIRSTGEGLSPCQFVGKAVDLDGDGKASDLIATTKDECYSPAASPIWVLEKQGSLYSVVLDYVSFSLELSNHKTNGLRDITVSRGYAGHAEVGEWVYDGDQYKENGHYYFNAGDTEGCKARRDICPFEIEEKENDKERFVGAWFSVDIPPNFTPRSGLKSLTSVDGVDTAWFASPDGSVEFYVCSPQWSREPTDFTSTSQDEEVIAEKHEGTDESEKETWWYTWKAKNGSYFKSLVIRREYSAKWAIGLKYRDQEAYERYKNDYIKFKKSLAQYAD